MLVLLLSEHLTPRTYVATACLVTIVFFTDAIDGYLARRWKATNALGYVLDSLGDRAIHVALLLIFFVRYHIHPLFVWLIIFRDIGVFAIRVLSKEWLSKAVELQWISRLQATFLRLWLILFIVRDGFRVFTNSDRLDTFSFEALQAVLLCATLLISYYGLVRSLSWPLDHNRKTL